MAIVTYTVQRPGEGPAILHACCQLARNTEFRRITGLYAFASYKGARLLVESLKEESSNWASVSKRWVISIDGGVTEPDALRYLLNISKSELHIPDAEELLTRRLNPIHRFHPKTLLLETKIASFEPTGLLVGSANMTCNGLCFGHEHAMSIQLQSGACGGTPEVVSDGLDRLEAVIGSATKVDSSFIERYRAIRPANPSLAHEFEDERSTMILQEHPVIAGHESAALASASHLWVDVVKEVQNYGKDKEGNQIDLQRGTRVFFGFGDAALPKNSPIGTINIQFGDHTAPRNLRFGSNSMDKFDLPIPGVEGPPSYRNQTLLFTRITKDTFLLTVGTPSDIANWKARSKMAGTLYKMKKGREFGVF